MLAGAEPDGLVKPAAGVLDIEPVAVGPGHQRQDRVEERSAERCELVIDAGWNRRVQRPRDQSVTLQAPECERQHPLGNPLDPALELAEAAGPASEGIDDVEAPFVADAVQDLTYREA